VCQNIERERKTSDSEKVREREREGGERERERAFEDDAKGGVEQFEMRKKMIKKETRHKQK